MHPQGIKGEKDLNILTLGIVYKGAAIPVYGLVLNKQGNFQPARAHRLVTALYQPVRATGILGVLADREFIGDHWWQWLSDQDIPYLIRMKENQLLTAHQGHQRPVRSLFADLAVGKSRSLRKRRRIGQQWVWLSAMKLDSGELLILASNHRFPQPLDIYGLRWEIEIDQPYCLHKRVYKNQCISSLA